MSELLDGIEAADLLQRMPSNVRTSLETLERAGRDWNAVGNLLAGTPNAGVALTGTGQWTADLWEAVKWEFRSFLCTESEAYADLRKDWDELKKQSSTAAVGSLSTLIGARLGVAGGVLAPLVIWLFVVSRRIGKEAVCLTLSAAPSISGSVQARPPYA
jgi:hypothetical protein